MTIDCVKAHAYGNDFLLSPSQQVIESARVELARRMCHRHTGIGADGLILYSWTKSGAVMTLYNADGSEAEVSGNGVRCLAAALTSMREHQQVGDSNIVIETAGGTKTLELLESAHPRYSFRADMGKPENIHQEELDVEGEPVSVVTLSVGNPQCIVLMPSYAEAERRFRELGPKLTSHQRFKLGTNVELVVVERPDRIRILIWERGVGPTSASGTGACASAVAAASFGGANRLVDVVAPGGSQRVEWLETQIVLTGWAELLMSGKWSGTTKIG